MILQALVAHYQDLATAGKVDRLGWGQAKLSFVLYLQPDGTLERVVDVRETVERGSKKIIVPQEMGLPSAVKRSSGVAPNFLWDNAGYILGMDDKGKPQRTAACFAACRELHEKLLSGIQTPMAQAIVSFFAKWEPENAMEHPALAAHKAELLAGANLTFRMNGMYAHEDPAVAEAWDKHFTSTGEGQRMVCLVTGEEGPVENIHPSIKNVAGAQSSGAALVSFNAPAFCSYGKEQNANAPTGKYASFAYTTALNHLLSDRDHVLRIGDTTVVCWAKGGETAYQDCFGAWMFDAETPYEQNELYARMQDLCDGKSIEFMETRLDPDREFYILGLAPNAARLSVRFFLRNSFGAFVMHVAKHTKRLEICRPSFDPFETLPIWRLLEETVNPNAREKKPVPGMAGEMVRAVLQDTRYPATLLNGVVLRIRAEQNVTRGRAAILKAYYLKNIHPDVPEEVLTVSCNQECTYVPYLLGRLFSVLEEIQEKANPGINTTIRDRYFNAASATPANVYPILINLAGKHLAKLEINQRIYLEKKMTELIAHLGTEFPVRMNLQEQGSFQLGYYHQTQLRYTAKKQEDNEND